MKGGKNMEPVVELITTLGFPMLACMVIYFDSRKDKERLYEALDKFGDKMDKFDGTLQSIDKRLQDLEKDVK